MTELYCPCLLCGKEVLLDINYKGYVPGYWVICPDCLENKSKARLWLSPFSNFIEIANSFESSEHGFEGE